MTWRWSHALLLSTCISPAWLQIWTGCPSLGTHNGWTCPLWARSCHPAFHLLPSCGLHAAGWLGSSSPLFSAPAAVLSIQQEPDTHTLLDWMDKPIFASTLSLQSTFIDQCPSSSRSIWFLGSDSEMWWQEKQCDLNLLLLELEIASTQSANFKKDRQGSFHLIFLDLNSDSRGYLQFSSFDLHNNLLRCKHPHDKWQSRFRKAE